MIKPINEYVNTLISSRRYDIMNEAKIISKKNPGGCGYPCTDIKFRGVNISIREYKGVNMEEQITGLEKDFPLIKSQFLSKFKQVFIPWVIGKDDISDHDVINGLKLYDIEYHYSKAYNESEFEFCYSTITNSNLEKILGNTAIGFNIEIVSGKIDKCSVHLI